MSVGIDRNITMTCPHSLFSDFTFIFPSSTLPLVQWFQKCWGTIWQHAAAAATTGTKQLAHLCCPHIQIRTARSLFQFSTLCILQCNTELFHEWLPYRSKKPSRLLLTSEWHLIFCFPAPQSWLFYHMYGDCFILHDRIQVGLSFIGLVVSSTDTD